MGGKFSVEKKKITVTVITWNLGNECPTSNFPFMGKENDSDIYAFGCQEAVYKARDGFLDGEQDFFISTHREIGEEKYEMIECQSLTPRTDKTYKSEEDFVRAVRAGKARPSGIRLVVFCKKSLLAEGWSPEDVEVNLQTCGRLGGVSGNKGGVCISFRLGFTWVSFISGHFNAHTHELERRVQDYGNVFGGLHPVSDDYGDATHYESVVTDWKRNIEVNNRSHVLYAFGDFNFRLEPQLPLGLEMEHEDQCEEVLAAVELRQWRDLAAVDQLLREQAKGRVFHGYVEKSPGHPTWAPTFKLNKKPGENPLSYNLKRCPSWCDRVLYRTVEGGKTECIKYSSHPEYQPNTSDHIPVSAQFELEVVRAQAKTVGASVAGMFRNKSDAKSRALILAHLVYEPDETFLAEAFEDEENTTLADAQLLVQCYHTKVAERGNTEPIPYNASGVRWSGQSIRMSAKGSISDFAKHPLIVCVRNTQSMEHKSHRFGETMVDLRELCASSDKDCGKGTFRKELLQRGTTRGFLSGTFEFEHFH
eukprot:m.296652 g.296652  ORF g.296652 m.296652 type:complete len:534 (-) comp20069_c0_seq5:352-1953(-)